MNSNIISEKECNVRHRMCYDKLCIDSIRHVVKRCGYGRAFDDMVCCDWLCYGRLCFGVCNDKTRYDTFRIPATTVGNQ